MPEDILRRLRALKRKKQPLEEVTKEKTEKEATIQRLKSMIAHVENRGLECRSERERYSNGRETAGLTTPDIVEGPGQNIEDLLPGEIIDTPEGTCFRVKTKYPWHHFQGDVPLDSLLEKDTRCLVRILGDDAFDTFDFRRALFFDTETTGLDTGAGTYIFLAGFGYFSERRFIVEQFFMRDFPEEPAVLYSIERLLERFDAIVTYNGKTYDWPLLESRFIINRKQLPRPHRPHLDLLHLSRKLYRHRLEDCRLPTIERNILNFHRVDDLPGAMLPELYFRYIRSRDARLIHQSFAHNAHDIVSLAAIASKILDLLYARNFSCHAPPDIYAVARLHDAAGEIDVAMEAYRSALQAGLQPALYTDALRRLSLLYKQQELWEEAVKLWEVMIQTCPTNDVFPYEETAKYFEHRKKDFKKALEFVERALVQVPQASWRHTPVHAALMHRKKRLQRKLEHLRSSGKEQDTPL